MGTRDAIVAEIPRLRRYARALTGNADAADDLVQETLERGMEKWRFWQSSRDLRPWLFSIIHNLHIDQLRRQHQLSLCAEEAAAEVAQRPRQTDALEVRDLDRALARLPLEQREVLLLVGLEELSYKEAATALGIPVGTVMSRLARARQRLREILAADAVPHLQVVN